MKQKTIRVAAAVLALAMLPGCGTTSVPPEATSINQTMLLEKAAQEKTDYTFPEKFTGDWVGQEGRLTIHADAQVVAEFGTALPTATVEPREFTQEDVDNLLKVLLKGEPLYGYTQTKQECQDSIDYANSDQWHGDPDAPEQTPEELEKRRQSVIAYYTEKMKTAPEEKPVIHGFYDSDEPNEVSGTATVDGTEWVVSIRNDIDGGWTLAFIERTDCKYRKYEAPLSAVSKEEAVAQGNALMQELGIDYALVDAQPSQEYGEEGNRIWKLYYAPTVNGIPVSGSRIDRMETWDDGTQHPRYQYQVYSASEETNPDTVSWKLEGIYLDVSKDGILSFHWTAPSTQPVVQQAQSTLLPFVEIASIADTMLPVVVIGPSEVRPLVEIDRINGFETRMDVEITKVSLSLMRIRDKGSLQGTIVPVWDFWGTWDWYDAAPNAYGYNEKGASYTTTPMLTLNAVDGTVVSRLFGY